MFLEKLLGVGIIIISFAVLALVSYFDPPTLVQIIIAFVGSFVCLIGIVISFAEDPIWIKERRGKTEKAPEADRTRIETAS
jgi:hypothetical protein